MKEKILMFGEGNFLRAFAAVAVQKLNENAGFDGKIICFQGLETGLCGLINAQGGRYTVIERGIGGGRVIDEAKQITCVSRCVDPYSDYGGYLEIAKNPDLRIVVSNTTEAGICYDTGETKDTAPRRNFPAKLTDFLYARFKCFGGAPDKGLIVLPCELTDNNG
ncbi:MAG: tagaturonate reductase, partial [Firmicutes bacterium]|nr:tagaturonate reductase [Bacillota bacterium]